GAAALGLGSMAHLTASSTWLVLLPGFVLAGIGLGITSTGLASAALSAVEPAPAGVAAGLTDTLPQGATAAAVAPFRAPLPRRRQTRAFARPGGTAGPGGDRPRAGPPRRLRSRPPGSRRGSPRRPRRGHPRRPRRHRRRAQ